MIFPAKFLIYRRSTAFVFSLGMLVGICGFWFIDVRRTAMDAINQNTVVEVQSFHKDRADGHHRVETLLAEELAVRVRVYALILTMPASKLTKAVHVKATWAQRFNGFMFISSEDDPTLPSIRAVDSESRGILWEKTRQAFFYAKKNLLTDYDFFMKADDDSYVIVENLRFILAKHDPNRAFIMGRRFNKFVRQGYTSGGAGYVVSRAALKLIAEGMESGKPACRKRGGSEDVNLGACAEAVGVKIIDSLDEHGEEAFHPFRPSYMLDRKAMENTKWVQSYNYYPIKTGLSCCSDHSVSFHYVSPNEMYLMEFLIYHLYPYGITRDLDQYNESLKLLHNKSVGEMDVPQSGKRLPKKIGGVYLS